MLDYETYCKIHDCHDGQHLTITQTARALGLHPQTVTKFTNVKPPASHFIDLELESGWGLLAASLP